DVDTELGTPVHLGRCVEAPHARAEDLPVLRVLERHFGRRGERRRFGGELPIREAPLAGRVDDRALFPRGIPPCRRSTSARLPRRAAPAPPPRPCGAA